MNCLHVIIVYIVLEMQSDCKRHADESGDKAAELGNIVQTDCR